MNGIEWAAFAVFVVVVMIVVYIDSSRKAKKRILAMLKKGWGNPPDKQYLFDEYENLTHYFYNCADKTNEINDTTWNDLDMDRVFKLINNTHSSVGQEYLYKMLRTPETKDTELNERDRLAKFYAKNQEKRISIQKVFINIGYASFVSLSDFIDMLVGLKPGSNMIHYLCRIAIIAAIIFSVTINAQFGILLIVGAMALCILSYYKEKAKIERYFICARHIGRLVSGARELSSLKIEELSEYNQELDRLVHVFSKFESSASALKSGSDANGSPAAVIADYFNMIVHTDLVRFNKIVTLLGEHVSEIYQLIDVLGKLEACIAIASFREMLPYWSVPSLDHSGAHLSATDLYHPLISEPVANTISENRSVLLTGSNASGKSTFLKTVAINAILSQTICTSVTKDYHASYFRICSSMALRDDLNNHESYYIVEIKTLKKILETIESGSRVPVLCFVDEVLRGTNTVERISASSEILHSLSKKNVLCFAATHDIELTTILEKYYANYHFQEEVSDDAVTFNYKLHKGRATSRNAIRLLAMIGYDKEIVAKSEEMARSFMNNGSWQRL